MAAQSEVSILWNAEDHNHALLIKDLLKSTRQFDCAVAFAKSSGLDLIYDALVKRLKNGMTARFIVGLDFCHTEPRLLDRLLKLKSKFSVDVLVAKEDSWTFHPKVYRFNHGDHISILIGSANLTLGGFPKIMKYRHYLI